VARPRNHLVIFLKAPQRGAVKTRLARAIGRAAAWRFYRDTSDKLIRDLRDDPRWTVWLAVTPDGFAREGRFWPLDVPRLPQGRGDLGVRMARPFRYLPPGPVVVVGSDIPDLRRRHVAQAFRLLRRVDVVFGPARDGGYWLIGHRRRPFVPSLFKDVSWSTEHALAQTRANVPAWHTVEQLEMLEDVDTETAWRRWRSQTR
jgi:rSAM/selenodomain-associated transferase 1